MPDGRLIIGNRRYSSWSMRGWLAVRLAELDVQEVLVPFARPGPTAAIRALSPNGLVPYLEHKGARVWESLALCEYCAEQAPALWPEDRVARAQARSVAAEMHAGFRDLRQSMWMNLGRDFAGHGRSPGALADIARIEALWAAARHDHGAGGPFLFGAAFTAADVMYAPVVTRFLTWQPDLSPASRAYCDAVRAHPLVAAWYDAAAAGAGGLAAAGIRDAAVRAIALDHAGVVGRDLPSLAHDFTRIGFCLTPLARHAGGRTGNRCAMLRAGYLELMAVLPGGASATLDRFLGRHAGIHTAALAIDDAGAELARLRHAGIGPAGTSEAERLVDDARPADPPARFTVLTPPDQPEGRILLIRHHTPALLWQDRFLRHPNHAVALAELLLACTEPAETAARLARLAGRVLAPDPLGGYALDLDRGRLRMLPTAAAAALLPGVPMPAPPCIAGVTLHTDDNNAGLLRRLDQERVARQQDGAAVVVQAGGAGLRFEPVKLSLTRRA